MTEYPSIFRDTYWGNFMITASNDPIYENRNSFVEDFRITSTWMNDTIHQYISSLRRTSFGEFLDHVEVYRTESKRLIIVTSPYCIDESTLHLFPTDYGFEQTSSLYLPNVLTFMKYTDMTGLRRELKRIRKQFTYV
jgi:hypothetical protein